MYRVYYWLSGQLFMISCGKQAGYAWKLVVAYYDYRAFLEYISEDKYA